MRWSNKEVGELSLAVVTGASSGFGADFARQLAQRGYSLVLVARREERLRELASELERDHSARSTIIVADLTDDAQRAHVAQTVQSLGEPVEVLVNNAGLGLYGAFASIPWEKERQMLDVDSEAVVHLTKLFVPQMCAGRAGYILNVSSIGAYQPTPLYASYSAAKAFVLSFSRALNYELRGSGVSVTVVSPGIAATEFLAVSKQQATLYQRMMMMQSRDVVQSALRALFARRPEVVPGFLNALTAFSMRFIPTGLQVVLANAVMRSNEPAH
jgi:short-subunit dehydrogenase